MTENNKPAEKADKKNDIYQVAKQLNMGGQVTHKIHVEFGELNGYFVFKYPTIGDKQRISVLQSNFLSGADPITISDGAMMLSFKMASLSVIVKEYPDWFKIESIPEMPEEIIEEIFSEYFDWYTGIAETYKKKSKK